MACTTCSQCHGSGVTNAASDLSHLTWCRACCGWGLQRIAEDDDEREDITLLWPESIRWKGCA